MKNILITGGAGFIGSHLVDRLLGEGGWQVTVVDDFNDFYSPEIKHANIAGHRGEANYRVIDADIRDVRTMAALFLEYKFDVIVHLAARAGVRPSLSEPRLYAETNINGTLNLLELAKEHHIKHFVFGSSSSVYGINAKVPSPKTTAFISRSRPTPRPKPPASCSAIRTRTCTISDVCV